MMHAGSGSETVALDCSERLRDIGLDVVTHCGGGSFKSQMKKADASGATLAVILGEDEMAAGEASLKPLREAGEQFRVKLEGLPEAVADFLYEDDEDE